MIGVDPRFFIRSIRFNSALFGVVAFSFGRGITESSGWEDEDAARLHSGTSKYYAMAGLANSPAVVQKVVGDTLTAAPDEAFRTMVQDFIAHNEDEIFYNFPAYKLEPIRTTGQIHILRYLKAEKKPDKITIRSFVQALLRNLNPVYVLSESYATVIGSLNRIHYTCTGCGAENSLLARNCTACLRPRPPIRLYALTLFIFRALIDMSYLLYITVTISFLIFTLFHLKARG